MSKQSTRRVFPLKVEPALSLTSEEREVVTDSCERLKSLPGALLPVCHDIQRRLGFVPKDAVTLVAHALNLSIAEVHGVLTFYHYFRRELPGRHVVHLCRAEACQAVGGVALEAHVKRSLGIEFHGTTADGMVSLEPVYCLGNCALGPSIMIDEHLKGRVSAQRFDALMAGLKKVVP
jgi:formate dehydrogenase subunit gamma